MSRDVRVSNIESFVRYFFDIMEILGFYDFLFFIS